MILEGFYGGEVYGLGHLEANYLLWEGAGLCAHLLTWIEIHPCMVLTPELEAWGWVPLNAWMSR